MATPTDGGTKYNQEAAWRQLWRWLTYFGGSNSDETAPAVKVSGVISVGSDINSDSVAVGGGENSTGTRHIAVVDSSGRWVIAPENWGVFNYGATTLSSGTFIPAGLVCAFRVFANGGDGSFQINGGNTITVRNNTGFDWEPRTPVSSPTFTWVSGTLDIFCEFAT